MFSAKMIAVFLAFIVAGASAKAFQGADDGLGIVQFLQELSQDLNEDQRNQLKAILTNPTFTKQQITEGLVNLFKNIGGATEVC